jgi:hypothetical protein
MSAAALVQSKKKGICRKDVVLYNIGDFQGGEFSDCDLLGNDSVQPCR